MKSLRFVGASMLLLAGSGFGQMAPPGSGASATIGVSAPGAVVSSDEQILQVLNRLTYGPRPGEFERVKAMGLNTWLKQQFNPDSIDDSKLDKMLADYPAMSLPLNKLLELYPTNDTIRQVMQGKAGVPRGDAARAIYASQEEKYKAQQQKKKDGPVAATDDPAPLPEAMSDPVVVIAMEPEKRFRALCKLNAAQVQLLRRKMTDDQKMQLTSGFTPQQIEAMAAFESPQNVIAAEEVQTKLLRDIQSERQLQEIMVDFWLNHFNVYIRKSQEAPYYITSYERDSIRPFALGRFEQLLEMTAMSPAMLNYLDNSSSIGPHSIHVRLQERNGKKATDGLNENYARELMELHTLGVNGGYTQHDVSEVAKVFTGWTVGKRPGQDMVAQAEFDLEKHEPGNKTVLGTVIKENDSKEGMQVLKLLANSPATARFISTKLAVRFCADDPPRALVDRMTAKWIATQGDIRQVLVAMITSPEFFRQGVYRAKVKTPQEYVVSAVRASGAEVTGTASLVAVLNELGMPLYGHLTPDGYSMKAEAWNNTASLVARMNFALALATNRVDGVKVDWEPLVGPDAGTAEEKDAVLEDKLLHTRVSDRTRQTILAQVEMDPAQREKNLKQIAAKAGGRDALTNLRVPRTKGTVSDSEAALEAGFLFGSPEFQRR